MCDCSTQQIKVGHILHGFFLQIQKCSRPLPFLFELLKGLFHSNVTWILSAFYSWFKPNEKYCIYLYDSWLLWWYWKTNSLWTGDSYCNFYLCMMSFCNPFINKPEELAPQTNKQTHSAWFGCSASLLSSYLIWTHIF